MPILYADRMRHVPMDLLRRFSIIINDLGYPPVRILTTLRLCGPGITLLSLYNFSFIVPNHMTSSNRNRNDREHMSLHEVQGAQRNESCTIEYVGYAPSKHAS